jgi:hypothetical protein
MTRRLYPHWDLSWPNTRRTVREGQDITDVQKKQFLSDNVQRFYGFTAETSNSAQRYNKRFKKNVGARDYVKLLRAFSSIESLQF